MTGETNLPTLLRHLAPVLQEGSYVFCTVAADYQVPLAEVLGTFREVEGLTLILPQATADRLGLPYDYVAAWLTLQVHSALAAVGLTAAFAQALATAGISCNVVAGYHHDHLFVARADAERALQVLQQLAARA
jgi:hypothetical protein